MPACSSIVPLDAFVPLILAGTMAKTVSMAREVRMVPVVPEEATLKVPLALVGSGLRATVAAAAMGLMAVVAEAVVPVPVLKTSLVVEMTMLAVLVVAEALVDVPGPRGALARVVAVLSV